MTELTITNPGTEATVYYSVTEAADLFGVSRQYMHSLIADGRLPRSQMVGGRYIIPASDLDEMRRTEVAKLREQLDALEALEI